MRCMLSICESYAADFCVSFNASKSKCVICTSRRKPTETEYLRASQFTINDNAIEFVQSWPHLGHIITMDDAPDIDRCRTKLISQINNVLCSLHQVDSVVKVNVLKTYCLSLYGCELWHLQHSTIENVCKSWRQGLRRVWGVPLNCRSVIVQILSDTIPLFDTIYKRSVSFMKNCLNSRSNVDAKFGVYFGHQNSVFGRNGSFCSEYFSLNVNDLMCDKCFHTVSA